MGKTKSTREWAKRKLKSSQGNLEWAVTHLKQISEKYQEQHPEISTPIENVMEVIVIAFTAIDEIDDMI